MYPVKNIQMPEFLIAMDGRDTILAKHIRKSVY